MAQWVKAPDNTYVQISNVLTLFIDKWAKTNDPNADDLWWIWGSMVTGASYRLRGISQTAGFATQLAAQNYLDATAIPAIGGAV
jgi:hypothetical protein